MTASIQQQKRWKAILRSTVSPWIVFMVLVPCLGGFIGLFWWQTYTPDPMYNLVAKLERGMSEAEVIDLFGGPGISNAKIEPERYHGDRGEPVHRILMWRRYRGEVLVYFDEENRVV